MERNCYGCFDWNFNSFSCSLDKSEFGRWKLLLARLVILLFILPLTYSTSCSSFPHQDYTWASSYKSPEKPKDTLVGYCGSLVDSAICNQQNISKNEKKHLILDLLTNSYESPDFYFVNLWNSNISFTKYSPDSYSNSGAVRNAWVKITYLTPSVKKDNKTLINNTGKIHSEFAFSFVPTGGRRGSDCKTTYSICGYNYNLDIFHNGVKINNGNNKNAFYSLQNVTHYSPQNFESVLTVSSQYLAHRYNWVKHCSKWSCWYTCDYYQTDNIKDDLKISNSKIAYYYSFNSSVRSIVDNYKNELLDNWFFVSLNGDFSNWKMVACNSSVYSKGIQYHLNYSYSPYNVLEIDVSENRNKTESYGLSILEKQYNSTFNKSNFLLHVLFPCSPDSCSITANSHFTNQHYSNTCKQNNHNPIINISITNKSNSSLIIGIYFYENTTKIPLQNKKINVSYASIEKYVITDSSGKATIILPYSEENNLVKTEFRTDLETKSAKASIIFGNNEPSFFNDLLYYAVLILLFFILYKLIRRLINHA